MMRNLIFLTLLVTSGIMAEDMNCRLRCGYACCDPMSESLDSPFRRIGNTIYLSGVPGGSIERADPQSEVKEALDNLKAAVSKTGGTMNDVVKITVYMVDATNDYDALNELTPLYFSKPYPARSPVGVSALPGGKRVEIDAVIKAL